MSPCFCLRLVGSVANGLNLSEKESVIVNALISVHASGKQDDSQVVGRIACEVESQVWEWWKGVE